MQSSSPSGAMAVSQSSDAGVQASGPLQADQGVRVTMPGFGVTLQSFSVSQVPRAGEVNPEADKSSDETLQEKDSIAASQNGFKSASQVEEFTPESTVPPPPPDGGLDAWLTVLGSVLVSFSTFGVVNSYGAFSDYYKTTYLSHYSATLVSMIGAVQVFILYGLGAFSGPLFDAYGPRLMIPTSGLIATFALFMLSLTQPQKIWQQYLTQAILFNIGASIGFFPAVSVIAHWFKRNAAYAMGCVIAGASAGGIVFPIMIHKLIPKIGFGWTVRAIAFIIVGCYSIACVTIKTRRPPKPLPPFTRMVDFGAFKDIRFALMAVGLWLNIISAFNPFFYIGLYGITTAGQNVLTPYLLTIMCATSIAGRVLPGIIADKVGRFNIITLATLLSGVLSLAMWYTSDNEAVLVTYGALYGFVSGPCFSLMPACVAQISPIEKVGARVGILFGFLSTGALLGTPVGGVFIKDQTKPNFQHLIIYTGVMGIAGACFLFAAKLKCNSRLTAIV